MQTDTNSQETVSIVKWFESLVLVPDGYPIGFSLAPGRPRRTIKLNDLTDPPRSITNDPGAPTPAPGRPTPPGSTT